MTSPLILASKSEIRRQLLERNGVVCEVVPAKIDEDSIKTSMLSEAYKPRDIADALAEVKALKVGGRYLDRVVLGADQVLELDGSMFSKAKSYDEAKDHLTRLSGKTHILHSAAVIVEDGRPIWRHVASVRMVMRMLNQEQITRYLEQAWPRVSSSVGCYQIENDGAQLFAQIHGSYFAVLGLPLLEVLAYLNLRGEKTDEP